MKTNYTLLLILISTLFRSLSNAQSSNAAYYLGIKGGASIPNLSSPKDQKNIWNKNYESRLGPYIGIQFEKPLSRHLSVQIEVDYVGEGGKRNGIQPMTIPEQYIPLFQQSFNTNADYIYADLNNVSRINFIQIPLLLKYNRSLFHSGKLKIYAQAGPFIGIMASAKQIVKTSDLKVYLDEAGTQMIPQQLSTQFFGSSVDTIIEAKNDLHHYNAGIQGAIGFSYSVGKGKIFIEGGGNYGFFAIQKGDEHGKDQMGAGTLLLGYSYELGKRK